MSAISTEYVMMQNQIREAFGDYVQVFMNIWAQYDLDTLGLLSDAEYKERRNRLEHISAAYVSINIEILNSKCLLERIDNLIEPIIDKPEHILVYKNYLNERKIVETWLNMQKTLLEQAKSQYAMHRAIGMIQAFQQKKQRGSILGAGRELIDKMFGKKKQTEREEQEAKAVAMDMPVIPTNDEEYQKALKQTEAPKGDKKNDSTLDE
jgi:plasmid maintenance system antidote protein VapI